ncbi:flagellar hook-length control protein FliK [Lysinibacillus composti]|uniref:Flagellar hook-length control protein FliK n=1 Tax=Lysinibacillus composti TaxID=720633 RepID=A0A3N9UFN9_9BACI|nr:flagellar hook-length control protein FliK [Lysinibacillus composti]MBM7608361.1 flagellar hook-length control protein FliK [Lysinibacillus composti]RQW74960.1 flagellar hook-length control protein FliK [Lysinibacillus composti]
MNIGIMQLSNVSMPAKVNSIMSTKNQIMTKKTEGFEAVFNKFVASKETTHSTETTSHSPEEVEVKQLGEVLETDSMEEVLDLLGISHDDGLLMIQAGEEGQAVAIDEMMNLDDLLAVFNMNPQQLMGTLKQIIGSEQQPEVTDIWSLIGLVNEQAPNVISQLTAALQGEHNVTPNEAKQFLEFLKLAQVVGKNTDLLGDQPLQLAQLKDLFQNLVSEVQTTQTSQTTGKMAIQGFQQVVQQVVKQTETQADSVNDSVNQSTTTTTATTKTITISLPTTEKSVASEALVKEIQSLLNRSQIAKSQGTMKLLLKLNPENLGSIRIELLQKDGVLSARLLASTSTGKELLDSQLNQLKSAFAQANIQMDRIDIAQSLQQTDHNFRDQNMFGNLYKQQQEQEDTEPKEQDDEEAISFSEFLKNEEV